MEEATFQMKLERKARIHGRSGGNKDKQGKFSCSLVREIYRGVYLIFQIAIGGKQARKPTTF